MFLIETERLLVRHFHICDAEAMERIFCDEEVRRFGEGVRSPEWVRNWLRSTLENQHRNWGFGQFAVVRKDRCDTIGFCGLNYYLDIDGQAEVEIGYRLARAHWGCGFATEAAIAVREHGFNVLCLRRLVALIDPKNIASVRVAEKLSMRHEKDVILPGYTYADRLYVVERTETERIGDRRVGISTKSSTWGSTVCLSRISPASLRKRHAMLGCDQAISRRRMLFRSTWFYPS